MKPKNFPQRKRMRRLGALNQRMNELAEWQILANNFIEFDAVNSDVEIKITIAKYDIANLTIKLGIPVVKFSKKKAESGKKNRRKNA